MYKTSTSDESCPRQLPPAPVERYTNHRPPNTTTANAIDLDSPYDFASSAAARSVPQPGTTTGKLALAAQPPDPPHWARWSQPPPHQQYVLLDSPASMMSYDVPRTQAPAAQQQQQHQQQQQQQHSQRHHASNQPSAGASYLLPSAYGGAAAGGPQPVGMSMGMSAGTHYVTSTTGAAATGTTTTTAHPVGQLPPPTLTSAPSMTSPRRSARRGSAALGMSSATAGTRSGTSPQMGRNTRAKTRNSPRQMVGAGAAGAASGSSAAASPTSATGTSFRPQFSTQVDILMRTIQLKADEAAAAAAASQAQQTGQQAGPLSQLSRHNSPQQPQAYGSQQQSGSPSQQHDDDAVEPVQKPFACTMPGCSMTFWQKTHLDIHRRSHTGEKPYVCSYAGCGAHFSQLGNLRTHERRHTGEKPFSCEKCGKFFAQRGNLKAHYKTHLRIQPFECRLDGCKKRFTQLGNMKAHQNKYHAGSLQALTDKFAAAADGDEVAIASITEADRELFGYFAGLYKNSNKGIKGRGKHRRVRPLNVSPGGVGTSSKMLEEENDDVGGGGGGSSMLGQMDSAPAPSRRHNARSARNALPIAVPPPPPVPAAYGMYNASLMSPTAGQQQQQLLPPPQQSASPSQYGPPHQQHPHQQHHHHALPPPPVSYGLQHPHHQQAPPPHGHHAHMGMHNLPPPQHPGHHGAGGSVPGTGGQPQGQQHPGHPQYDDGPVRSSDLRFMDNVYQ